jgi:hypothetical protein
MKLADAEKSIQHMLSNRMAVDASERAAAICRQPELRTKPPEPGDRVWYRHEPFGELTEAMVECVDDSNPLDHLVWRHSVVNGVPVMVDGRYVMEQVDDPWPDVYLHTRWGRMVTREARIEGSPGWLLWL